MSNESRWRSTSLPVLKMKERADSECQREDCWARMDCQDPDHCPVLTAAEARGDGETR